MGRSECGSRANALGCWRVITVVGICVAVPCLLWPDPGFAQANRIDGAYWQPYIGAAATGAAFPGRDDVKISTFGFNRRTGPDDGSPGGGLPHDRTTIGLGGRIAVGAATLSFEDSTSYDAPLGGIDRAKAGQRTRSASLGFSIDSWREAGLSESWIRPGTLAPGEIRISTLRIETKGIDSGIGGRLGPGSLSSVLKDALKLKFVWHWEKGHTTVQFQRGMYRTMNLGSRDSTGADGAVTVNQINKFGRWSSKLGVGFGRTDGGADDETITSADIREIDERWLERSLGARAELRGSLDGLPDLAFATGVVYRRLKYLESAHYDVSTAWKFSTSLQFAKYIKTAPSHRPYLNLSFIVSGNGPDTLPEQDREPFEFIVGVATGIRF